MFLLFFLYDFLFFLFLFFVYLFFLSTLLLVVVLVLRGCVAGCIDSRGGWTILGGLHPFCKFVQLWYYGTFVKGVSVPPCCLRCWLQFVFLTEYFIVSG